MHRMVTRLEVNEQLDLEIPNPSQQGVTKLGGQVCSLRYGPDAGKTVLQLYQHTSAEDYQNRFSLIVIPLEDVPSFNCLVGQLVVHLLRHGLLSYDDIFKNLKRPIPAIDDSPGNGGEY